MNKIKKFYSISMLVVLIFSILGSFQFVSADNTKTMENKQVISDIVTNINMTRNDGSDIGTIDQWTDILVTIDFTLPNNKISAGDTTTISLPKELELQNDSTFEVKDDAGNVVATAYANQDDKTVKLIYTDYAEKNSNISGKLWFSVQVDSYTITETGKIPLEFDIDGQTIIKEIEYEKGTGDQDEVLYKSGVFDPNGDPQVINYSLRVNVSSKDLTDVVVSDLLGQQDILINQDSIKIQEIDYTWNNVDEDWNMVPNSLRDVTDAFSNKITMSNGNKGFSIGLGNINRPYLITYDGIIGHIPAQGESFDNKAVITANEIETTTSEKNFVYSDEGGSAAGNTYQIHLIKQDKENATLLNGAEFDVIRVSTNRKVGTIATVNGEGQIKGLLQDSYQLIETKAPVGYTLDPTPILVTPADFKESNSLFVATITATNEKEKTEISGIKMWDDFNNKYNTRPESITVILLQNGQIFEKQEVKADDQGKWTFNFTNLPKSDTNGVAYACTLDEVEVAKYKKSIDNTTITNTLTELPENPVIPVVPEEPSRPELPSKPVAPQAKTESFPKTGEEETVFAMLLGLLFVTGAAFSFIKKLN
ncbi:MAG: Cna B-type domain-containing protein [Carnobacterium sp.]|uniref:Ig-like domain-containing protein n=1 Tax=Carnobacterium sp. TaxID=48221 RepID=UPI00257D3ED2|nr:Ig-like domain-containing protein [Carnobacterium sp.]MBQ6486003.1 Cna B-type domain-containing protein [Carnobacterium sp.]